MAATDDFGAVPRCINASQPTSRATSGPVYPDTLGPERDVGVITEIVSGIPRRPPQSDHSSAASQNLAKGSRK